MFNNLEHYWQDEDGTISLVFGGGSFGKMSLERASDLLVFLLSKKVIVALKSDKGECSSGCGGTDWKPTPPA